MKAHDNPFPSVLFDDQGSAPATPDAGFSRIFTKSDGLYVVDDAGNVVGPLVSAAAALGAWTSYTPTWSTDGSAPTIGNGSLTGRYKLLDASTYLFRVTLVAGSTTTFGTGNWKFALPATAVGQAAHCYGLALDSSAGTRDGVNGYWDNGDTSTLRLVPDSASVITNTSPWTWAVSDELRFSGFMEA